MALSVPVCDHCIPTQDFGKNVDILYRRANQHQETCDLLAPSVSAFAHSQNVINEPYDWDTIGRPKLSKVKLTSSDKPLAQYSAISHGIRIQMLLHTQSNNYCVAYLACRFQSRKQTLLGLLLELEETTGQYRRVGLGEAKEYVIDSLFSYRATLQDVYVAAPRLDFALSLRPVRYQIENLFFTNGPPQSFLTFMDEAAVQEAHFIPVDYYPPKLDWGVIPGTDDVGSSPGLWLWHDDRNSAVIYKHEETAESFAVVIGSDQKFNPEPSEKTRFLAAIVDNIDSGTAAKDVLDDFFGDSAWPLTDLSTQMLVKCLISGKKVILSVNANTEKNRVSQKIDLTYQAFRLWVAVKEGRKIR